MAHGGDAGLDHGEDFVLGKTKLVAPAPNVQHLLWRPEHLARRPRQTRHRVSAAGLENPLAKGQGIRGTTTRPGAPNRDREDLARAVIHDALQDSRFSSWFFSRV